MEYKLRQRSKAHAEYLSAKGRCSAVRAVFLCASVAGLLFAAGSGSAEEFPIDLENSSQIDSQNQGFRQAGRTTDTGVGEVGIRQASQDTGVNIAPTGRINNRIENRVQGRQRNRIDRYYNVGANAASASEAAEKRGRSTGLRRHVGTQ